MASRRKGLLVRTTMAAAMALAFPSMAASLHECKLPDGRTELLWTPCPEPAAPATAPAAKPAPAAPPAKPQSPEKAATPAKPAASGTKAAAPPQKAAPASPPMAATKPAAPFGAPPPGSGSQLEREMVIEILSGYASCAADIEGFKARNAAAYDFWKLRNAAGIARVQADTRARDIIEQRIADDRRESAEQGPDAYKKAYCETIIGPFLQGRFSGTPGTGGIPMKTQ